MQKIQRVPHALYVAGFIIDDSNHSALYFAARAVSIVRQGFGIVWEQIENNGYGKPSVGLLIHIFYLFHFTYEILACVPILKYMGLSHLFSIILRVVSDLRLVLACVAVLLYVNFVFYVARYHKKKKFRKKPLIRVQAGSASSSGADAGGTSGANADSAKEGSEKSTDENSSLSSDAASAAAE